MGKAALEQWRAKKAQTIRRAMGPYNTRPSIPLPPRHERYIKDERIITRIVAALIAGVPVYTIARDLRLPKRTVWVVALRERSI